MARTQREGYDFLLPIARIRMEQWGLERDFANRTFGWGFSRQKLGQIFTSGDFFPLYEINKIYRDLRQWGKDHNFPNWEDIPDGN